MSKNGDYTVLEKEGLFVEKGIKESCSKYELIMFPGVVLAVDRFGEYVVAASTMSCVIKEYRALEKILPNKSDNIFETFNNEDEARRFYKVIAEVFSKVPKFKPSDKMCKMEGFYITSIRERGLTHTCHEYLSTKKIFEFTKGNSIRVDVSKYKMRLGDSYIYVAAINELLMFEFLKEDEFKDALDEILKYADSLKALNVEIPKWFNIKNTAFGTGLHYFKDLAYSEYCQNFLVDVKEGRMSILLKRDEHFFKFYMSTPTRNASKNGSNVDSSIEASKELAKKLKLDGASWDWSNSLNRYIKKREKLENIDFELIYKVLKEVFC